MTSEWWNDDDTLLAAVTRAIREAEDVPPSIVEAGKMAFAWHNIDAELAALTYDSSRDVLAGASTRSATEPAELRCLKFDASELSIELEIIGDVLHGQLVPAQPGEVGRADRLDQAGRFLTGTARVARRSASTERRTSSPPVDQLLTDTRRTTGKQGPTAPNASQSNEPAHVAAQARSQRHERMARPQGLGTKWSTFCPRS